MKKKGFTLAEILITLGIVGIISALTIPNLLANYQKKQIAEKLKVIWSQINHAYKMSVAENGSWEGWTLPNDMSNTTYIETYWMPYIKVAKVCSPYTRCGYSSGTPFKKINNATYTIAFQKNAMFLLNGAYISFYNNQILVDINGINGPNREARDLFWFNIDNNGIIPKGHTGKYYRLYCTKEDTGRNDSGEYCAGKIMYDGWQIKNDYPW